MIDDIAMTLQLAEYPNITELIVSRKVLLEMLRMPEVTDVRLNTVQESPKYRYLHSIRWRGKLFINPSEQPITWRRTRQRRQLAG